MGYRKNLFTASILAFGLAHSSLANAQAQQGQMPRQNQQQARPPSDSVLQETHVNWKSDIRTEGGIVTQARAWADDYTGSGSFLVLVWTPQTATNPSIQVHIPEVNLRAARDFTTRNLGYSIEVVLQAHGRIFSVTGFDFSGNTYIERGGSPIVATDIIAALAAGDVVNVDFRVRDEEGRVRRIYQRDFILPGARAAIQRAQGAFR